MFCSTNSCAVSGTDTQLITVEADIRNGLPGFFLCGASNELKEAKERVRVAIENAGFLIPPKRITVNLHPLGQKGPAGFLDMAVAVAVLAAYGMMPDDIGDVLFAGELSLSGMFKPLPSVGLMAVFALENGFKRLIVPKENAAEAALFQDLKVYGAENLMQVLEILDNRGEAYIEEVCDVEALMEYEHHEAFEIEKEIEQSIIGAAVTDTNIMFVGGSEERFNKLISCLENIKINISDMDKIKLSEYNKVLTEKSPYEIKSNGIFVVHNMEKNKTKDYSQMLNKIGDRGITVMHGSLCPCGYYPDKNLCKCSKSKRSAFMSKLNSDLFLKPTYYVVLSEESFDNGDKQENYGKRTLIKGEEFSKRVDTIKARLKEKDKEINLIDEEHDYFEEVFKYVKYTKQLYDLIINTAFVLALCEAKDRPDLKNLTEAVYLCTLYRRGEEND